MPNLTYILVRLTLGIFSILPVALASAIGGRLAQLIGPHTKRHRVARKNLERIP